MLYLLEKEIGEAHPSRKIYLIDTIFTRQLLRVYRSDKSGDSLYDVNADTFLQRFGSTLTPTSEIGGIFHIHGNHWVAAAVDIVREALAYGDPAGGLPDDDVIGALRWFVSKHLPSYPVDCLDSEIMPCPTQHLFDDWWSCGIFSNNGLARFFIPSTPMVGPSHAETDLARMSILRRLIMVFNSKSSNLDQALPLMRFKYPSSSRSAPSPRPEPITKIAIKNVVRATQAPITASSEKPKPKQRKVKNTVPSVIAPIFQARPKRTVEQLKARSKVRKTASGQDVASAMDNVPSDASSDDTAAPTGRPRMNELDTLTVELKSERGSHRKYRCAGVGCSKTWEPRSRARVLAHCKGCLKMTSEQRQFASAASAENSPGALVAATESLQGTPCGTLSPATSMASISSTDSRVVAIRASAPPRADEFFGMRGRKEIHNALDFAILKLVCVARFAPAIVDLDEWKDIYKISTPSYTPASRTRLVDNHIMSEQERVRALVIDYLQTQDHLTVTFDGGDTLGGDTFYTVHVTTPTRQVFLIEGQECTRESHTGEWIANLVMRVIHPIGPQRFIAMSSDDTGNTQLARAIMEAAMCNLLNLPDPMHHLSNTLKEIAALPYFKVVIKRVRGTIKYFKQSKPAKAKLKDRRVEQGLGPGLESIGKTRFATLTWSAESLRRCLPAIRDLVTSGEVDIPKHGDTFINNTATTLKFEIYLTQFLKVTMGIARAIQCLEASSTNAADVYLYWLAVVAQIKQALSTCCLPDDVCAEIRGIMIRRWRQFFVTGPTNVHLLAFYLNPRYVRSSIFKNPNPLTFNITLPAKVPPKVPPGIKSPKTFLEVGRYLLEIAVNEINHGSNPVLTSWKPRPTAFTRAYQAQFTAYAQRSYPFNVPLGEDQDPLDWWLALEETPNAEILAAIAIKLYSAVPHSMADERTMSVVTMMNTALQNRQKVETIMAMAQIRNYYRTQKKRKLRKSARPRPILKFYDVNRVLRPIDEEEDEEGGHGSDRDVSDDQSGGESDDEGATKDRRKHGTGVPCKVEPSSVLPMQDDDDFDMSSLDLEELLTDAPVSRSVKVGAVPKSRVPVAGVVDREEDGGTFELGDWM
ncbi:ribonuclease H-like domain-containing protein [Lyophyllum atratum]|nr:ribonuclease H-like domain-containing protein [Lyophyllum atratum]